MRNYIIFTVLVIAALSCSDEGDTYLIVNGPCNTDWDCTNKAPECTEDGILITYLDGYCEDQNCVMDFEEVVCGLSCIAADTDTDAWEPNVIPAHCEKSCEGIVCNTPPDDFCFNGLLYLYHLPEEFGWDDDVFEITCFDGKCDYLQSQGHEEECSTCIEKEGNDVCGECFMGQPSGACNAVFGETPEYCPEDCHD